MLVGETSKEQESNCKTLINLPSDDDHKITQQKEPYKEIPFDHQQHEEDSGFHSPTNCNHPQSNSTSSHERKSSNQSVSSSSTTGLKKKRYCICQTHWTGSDKRFMIKCDKCKLWYHGDCLPQIITEENSKMYLKFYCFQCEPKYGPGVIGKATRKSTRKKNVIDYNELNEGIPVVSEFKYTKLIQSKRFPIADFPRLKGQDLTLEYVKATGLIKPVIIEDPDGLDMIMPTSLESTAKDSIFIKNWKTDIQDVYDFHNTRFFSCLEGLTVRKVAELCGLDTEVQVLQVATQSEAVMTLKEWADYFEQPKEKRKQILNVISLEISDSELGKQIKRPKLVRKMDWTDLYWPKDKRTCADEYPQVQLYCLMSVENSFTDFHIDFGGTSVFYHLISGEKIFYFIEPTAKNLKKYAKWANSADQSETFLGDLIHHHYRAQTISQNHNEKSSTDEQNHHSNVSAASDSFGAQGSGGSVTSGGVVQVTLCAGQTMIIPSGWIHAVFTPKDSLVIGGNFLHGFHIKNQLEIYQVENETDVPIKFRFPFYERTHWYAAMHYHKTLKDDSSQISDLELIQLPCLIEFLKTKYSEFQENVTNSLRKSESLMEPNQVGNIAATPVKTTSTSPISSSYYSPSWLVSLETSLPTVNVTEEHTEKQNARKKRKLGHPRKASMRMQQGPPVELEVDPLEFLREFENLVQTVRMQGTLKN